MIKLLVFLAFLLITIAAQAQTKIVFIGDSLTEGYGIEKSQAYPDLVQKKLNEQFPDKYEVINAGISGSTTASGLSRAKWFLKAGPKLVVLALGANDGLRGIKVSESKKNLSKTIEFAQKNNIKVILAEMHIPTNYGEEYRKKFNKMFLDLKEKYQTGFIPFMLKDVGGKKELNLDDGIHPNAKGHEIVAKHIYKHLKEYL